jgi:hypothetical protein
MAQRKKGNSLASLVLIIVLFLAFFLVKQCRISDGTSNKEIPTTSKQKESRGLDRDPDAINYSKHARCRMQCRHIDETEVKEILQTGKINYGKSEIGDNPDCKRRYAVEGKTHDNQRVRIVFAPCQSEVTVVTVIDLGTEWTCDCP